MTRGKLFLIVALGAVLTALMDRVIGIDYGDLSIVLVNLHRSLYIIFGAVLYACCAEVFGVPWKKKESDDRTK
ncbi:hypothetical protein AMJ57_01925 [Parcubacteria bacterium SG8_24]|nr:MAG: hypothetical protein AMJ57_01925 [Parcubacteria bacterium SG8_24]